MARPLRIHFPDVPLHLVQRGHDRRACFHSEQDRLHYLSLLHEVLSRSVISLHAYVLMTNHIHLLVTPTVAGSVSSAIKAIGGRYVRYFNERYGRVGTLWDGRFRSSLVQTERYLFACQRYIELNPVRAGVVADPASHRWSSYRHHAYGAPNRLITPSVCYLALGDSPEERQAAYRERCGASSEDELLPTMRSAFNGGRPLGDSAFLDIIERVTGQPSRPRPRGRLPER